MRAGRRPLPSRRAFPRRTELYQEAAVSAGTSPSGTGNPRGQSLGRQNLGIPRGALRPRECRGRGLHDGDGRSLGVSRVVDLARQHERDASRNAPPASRSGAEFRGNRSGARAPPARRAARGLRRSGPSPRCDTTSQALDAGARRRARDRVLDPLLGDEAGDGQEPPDRARRLDVGRPRMHAGARPQPRSSVAPASTSRFFRYSGVREEAAPEAKEIVIGIRVLVQDGAHVAAVEVNGETAPSQRGDRQPDLAVAGRSEPRRRPPDGPPRSRAAATTCGEPKPAAPPDAWSNRATVLAVAHGRFIRARAITPRLPFGSSAGRRAGSRRRSAARPGPRRRRSHCGRSAPANRPALADRRSRSRSDGSRRRNIFASGSRAAF